MNTVSAAIPLSRPNILDTDIERAVAVLRTGNLVQGPAVETFERHVAAQVGVAHARAVANGTAALHLALDALGIGPGDEVVVPAFSYVATANVVELVGATPVFADIDLATFNVMADAVETVVTPRTRALLPVHEFGLVCDIEAIVALGADRGIPVVEDAACALGATSGGRAAGSFGAMGCFSLHPRKTVTSGEGGLVTTDDPALAATVDRMRNHGIAEVDGRKEFVAAGFNYRLTDFQAALVDAQMERLATNLRHRDALAAFYADRITNPLVTVPRVPAGKRHSWQSYHVLLDASFDRDRVIAHLREAGIGSNLGAQCIPAQTFYQARYRHDVARAFPNALRAYTHGLAIPMSDTLSLDDAARVADHLNAL